MDLYNACQSHGKHASATTRHPNQTEHQTFSPAPPGAFGRECRVVFSLKLSFPFEEHRMASTILHQSSTPLSSLATGEDDAFLGLLDADDGNLVAGWQFGGEGSERVYAMGMDEQSGDIIVGGYTTSSLFATNGVLLLLLLPPFQC